MERGQKHCGKGKDTGEDAEGSLEKKVEEQEMKKLEEVKEQWQEATKEDENKGCVRHIRTWEPVPHLQETC